MDQAILDDGKVPLISVDAMLTVPARMTGSTPQGPRAPNPRREKLLLTGSRTGAEQ